MNERQFKSLLHEIIDRNAFAVRAMLLIVTVEFTESVPTLAVTCESPPRMLVNLAFLQRHCRNEQHVKAVILHEFLHVLLRHTEDRRPLTPARHLAFDAVINAIIHRQCGVKASGMMSEYYADARGPLRLLRPMTEDETWDYWKQRRNGETPDAFLNTWASPCTTAT